MTTNRKFRPGEVDLDAYFDPEVSDYVRNRRLFDWLSDWHNHRPDDPASLPAQRDALFAGLLRRPRLDGVLTFPSRAIRHPGEYEPEDSLGRRDPTTGHKEVHLLLSAEDIAEVLANGTHFSNEPYNKLGSGSFLLGLDDPVLRDRQRQ